MLPNNTLLKQKQHSPSFNILCFAGRNWLLSPKWFLPAGELILTSGIKTKPRFGIPEIFMIENIEKTTILKS